MMKTSKTILILLLSLFVFYSCSDDSTSPGQDEPPALPETLTPAEVDISFFQQNTMPSEEQYESYNQSAEVANMGNNILMAGNLASTGNSFLIFAQFLGGDPEFDSGAWVWTITFSEDMFGDFSKQAGTDMKESWTGSSTEEFTIQIRATPGNGGIQWEIYFTGDIGDGFVENFKLMGGFTSDDGMSGEWNFYNPETGNPIFAYEWSKNSETSYTTILSGWNEQGTSQIINVEYTRNAPENWMEISEGSQSASVYWNENTNSGWVEQNGARQCFQNFENAPC